MSNIPDNLKYTQDHTWVYVEGNSITIGITEFAQKELGDIVFVDIPANAGQKFDQGDAMGTIESVKAVTEIYAPITGTLKEINQEITEDPETINDDPYGDGWLAKLTITDQSQLKSLLSADEYRKFIADSGD